MERALSFTNKCHRWRNRPAAAAAAAAASHANVRLAGEIYYTFFVLPTFCTFAKALGGGLGELQGYIFGTDIYGKRIDEPTRVPIALRSHLNFAWNCRSRIVKRALASLPLILAQQNPDQRLVNFVSFVDRNEIHSPLIQISLRHTEGAKSSFLILCNELNHRPALTPSMLKPSCSRAGCHMPMFSTIFRQLLTSALVLRRRYAEDS